MKKETRSKQIKSASTNPTLKKLAGTPFKTASELNEAREAIYKQTWSDLTRAQSYHELTKKEEFSFYVKDFEKGLRCRYGSNPDDIVSVQIQDGCPIVSINENMKSDEHGEKFVSSLAQSLTDSFYANYLKSMRILPNAEETTEEIDE